MGEVEFLVLYIMFPSVVYFMHSINSVYVSIQSLSSSHPTPFPLGSHSIVVYTCVSISVLQIRLSIPLF